MRLIDAEELKKEKIEARLLDENGVEFLFRGIPFIALETAPTIEAKPVIHAYWIKEGNERTCSDCGFFYYSNKNDFYYCPKCGAQMDKVVSKADELDSLEKPNSQSGAENE